MVSVGQSPEPRFWCQLRACDVTFVNSMNTIVNEIKSAIARSRFRRVGDDPRAGREIRQSLPPVTRRFGNCRFHLNPSDNFSEFSLWLNGKPPEAEATLFLADMFRGKRISLVDVGANAGLFSIPILSVADPQSSAQLIEPNPVMQKRLVANLALNRLSRFSPVNAAISDERGSSSLYFPSRLNLGQGRIEKSYSEQWAQVGVTVPVIPLEDAIDTSQPIDLLKVDVEGLEDRVIVPFLRKGFPPPKRLYFEVEHKSHWKYPLIEELTERGYDLHTDFGNNRLYTYRLDSA